jgi:ketosteroid isomerase-like protein
MRPPLKTKNNGRAFHVSCGLAFLMTVALTACQPTTGPATANSNAADSNTDTEAASIRSEADAWFKAIAAKDLEKTLSFYAPDAQYLSAGRPAAATPEARRKLWVEDYATPGFSSDEMTTQIEVAGSKDLAYQRGTYVSTMQNEQGQMTKSAGKFVVVWKKQGGRWKAIIDMDNTDQ